MKGPRVLRAKGEMGTCCRVSRPVWSAHSGVACCSVGQDQLRIGSQDGEIDSDRSLDTPSKVLEMCDRSIDRSIDGGVEGPDEVTRWATACCQ